MTTKNERSAKVVILSDYLIYSAIELKQMIYDRTDKTEGEVNQFINGMTG
jgi:hypothetical protein